MPSADEPADPNTLPYRPPDIDNTQPSQARVYDAFLGGKDNFEVDRMVRDQVLSVAPALQICARESRRWLIRVVRHLAAAAGIDQFLDCGSGLPTAENTHQIAQQFNPEARVVYVDNDPVVLAHGQALLEDNDRTHFISADLTRPAELLANPGLRRLIDLSQPIALIQCNTFHAISEDARPAEIMRTYVDALAPGSYVAVAHFHLPNDGSELDRLARGVEAQFQRSFETATFRTREQIEQLFAGTEILPPGLVGLSEWWPEGPRMQELPQEAQLLIGGLARKA